MAGMRALYRDNAVTDPTLAANINKTGSNSQQAVDARIRPVASEIINSDPTFIQSAKDALQGAANDAGFLMRTELGAVRTLDVDVPLYSEVRLSFDYRRVGGTLRTGGEVGTVPSALESATPSGAGTIELSRDYRRVQPGSSGEGLTPQHVLDGWAERLPGLGFPILAGWGDSMTTDHGALNNAQIALVAADLGVGVYDGGWSGHTPTEIAFRAGALPVHLTVSGGTIPASGTVAATVTPTLGWWHFKSIPASVMTADGAVISILLKHASDAPGDAPVWTVEQVAGTTPARVLDGSRIVYTTPKRAMQYPAIYWVGRNDPDEERVLDALEAMVATHRDPGDRLLILPIFNRINSPEGSASYIRDMAINAKIRERWPHYFFDSRRRLIDYGLQILGMTPTAEDVAAIAEDRIPPSLMLDITHLNVPGRRAHSRILATEIIGRNW